MRKMRLFSQSIHHQSLAPLNLLHRTPADEFGVGNIDQIAHTIGRNRQFVMHHLERQDFQVSDPERLVIHFVERKLGRSRIAVLGKSIRNRGPQGLQRNRVPVNRHRMLLVIVERPHIVQTAHMIPVGMSQQNRIHVLHPGPQHLVAEIRPGINHYLNLIRAYQSRSPQSLVMTIRRLADRAMATDNRHALRSPCP